ncbi:AAA family ATPase [Diaphorobacter sp. J5-51]|uniref:AAA family ATPase n=1 Tax=Diaphorobacter sp. J5-51 TaxID=680496 RepID=UPI00069BED2A|nr:AAA family ATPase [Diaphorobacter sp. J5-51]
MKLPIPRFPELSVVVPDGDDALALEAYQVLAVSLAIHLSGRRALFALELHKGPFWLGVKVHTTPALSRRERQSLLLLVRSMGFMFPWIPKSAQPEAHRQAETLKPSTEAGTGMGTDTEGEASMEAFVRSLIEDGVDRSTVQVFDPGLADTAALIQQLPIDGESRQKMQMALKKLLAYGTKRPRSQPDHSWLRDLGTLRGEFPAFATVVDQVVQPHLSLIAAGARRVRMPPILLVGPPGVGKTAFARRLAVLLGTGCLSIDMASATNGASLAGSSTFWSNSQPGQLFTAIAFGIQGNPPCADPVVVLDEIDKVSSDRYDPMGPLYTLLEEETARVFEDQALPGIVFDASLVRWIITANDIRRIPDPILSRVLVYEIEPPSGNAMFGIAQQMLESTVRELGIHFLTRLPRELAPLIGDQTPRTLKVRLELAVGAAMSAGRNHLVLDDLTTLFRTQTKLSMGFV